LTKVVHVISGLLTGGAETMLSRLLTRVDRSRFQAAVISLKSGPLERRIRDLGIEVISFGMRTPWSGVRALPALRRHIRRLDPDLIQGWMVYGNLAANYCALAAPRRAPMLWNLRHSLDELTLLRPRTRWVLRRMAALSSRSDAVIFNSRTSARQHEAIGYDRRRTRVLPNGFDLDVFRPDREARSALRHELRLGEETPLVGIVARYHPVKDYANFLEAARRLAAAGSPAHFLAAGRGTDGGEMATRIGALGLGDRIHALGERQDVPRITAALDIATCCSVSEAFPNMVGEAMSCGVPCVVTDVGDSAWMIDGMGRVIRPRDSGALCEAWQSLLALTAAERTRIGEAARERVRAQFSLPEVARRYEELWTEVLERRGARPAAGASEGDGEVAHVRH
jgi:glycosyltransferase involved in cell wall biosynthesis